MTSAQELLEGLCAILEDELERQENVLAVCTAQGTAARAQDLAQLEANTAALTALIDQAAQAEPERLRLVTGLVVHYELPPHRQTLSALIELAPEPYKHRLIEFQLGIHAVLAKTRCAVRENSQVIRRSLRIFDEAIQLVLMPAAAASTPYSAGGAPLGVMAGNLLDHRG